MAPPSNSLLVLGAGPAGLAAALLWSRRGRPVQVLERDQQVGGLSRTVRWEGYRFDIGGHRFFTRTASVQRLWEEVLGDELLLRPRQSRILYRGRLFDYPLRPANALRNLGPVEAARCVASFGRARLRRRGDEQSFEEWVSNRFGDRLFDIFFRSYTEKVWGIPTHEISADWASQRIKNLSLSGALRAAFSRTPASITSLVEQFHYPRYGPGQMYEGMAEQILGRGGTITLGAEVVRLQHAGGKVQAVEVRQADGARETYTADHILSSIPLHHLITALEPAAPEAVRRAAAALRFRHLVSVNLVVHGADLFPDNWVYVHSPELRVGRIQNYGNWSPDMVPHTGQSALGMEYFTEDGDALWAMSDAELLALATRELAQTGLCAAPVVKGMVVRAPRAYPMYTLGYEAHVACIADWLRLFENLAPMGRYGMFKYNNSDHSILTAMLSVENIEGAGHDVWAVNADEAYQEQRPSGPEGGAFEGPRAGALPAEAQRQSSTQERGGSAKA